MIGISLGLMILFYVFVGATVLIYYVIYLLVHSYNRLISLEVQPSFRACVRTRVCVCVCGFAIGWLGWVGW